MGPAKVVPDARKCSVIDVTLESVLRDNGSGCSFPLLLPELHSFLSGEQSQENLEFILLSERFKSLKSDGGEIKQFLTIDSAILPEHIPKDVIQSGNADTLGDFILSNYFEKGGAQELNVDAFISQRICSTPKSERSFQPAQVEIEELIANDSFPRFKAELKMYNISEPIAKHRKTVGVVSMIVFAAILAALYATGLSAPYWRLLSLPFGWFGLAFLLSGAMKV